MQDEHMNPNDALRKAVSGKVASGEAESITEVTQKNLDDREFASEAAYNVALGGVAEGGTKAEARGTVTRLYGRFDIDVEKILADAYCDALASGVEAEDIDPSWRAVPAVVREAFTTDDDPADPTWLREHLTYGMFPAPGARAVPFALAAIAAVEEGDLDRVVTDTDAGFQGRAGDVVESWRLEWFLEADDDEGGASW